MKHTHLEECNSTQTYLIEKYQDDTISPHLVTTDKQNQGKGRGSNHWQHLQKSLAMSFTLEKNEVLSLTSLEVGLIILKFFEDKKIKLQLKWPNDIFFQSKKIGGIIMNNLNIDNHLIVGVGINLAEQKSTFECIPIQYPVRELSLSLYSFILNNRIDSKKVINNFNKNCLHFKKEVSIDMKHKGIFIGVGDKGQALIKINGSIKEFFTGSLFI